MRFILVALFLVIAGNVYSQSYYLFVGTYTDAGSKGIYVYRFNAATGKAEWVSNTDGIVNPSFLTIAPNKKYLYAVTETATNDTGSVSAFSFDRSSGKLSFINKQKSGGANPCYITTDRKNKWVLVGNYTGGSLAALKINEDGSLAPHAQVIQHTGTSINKTRQDRPHVHCTVFSPDYKFLFTPDLGLDKVMIYAFKPKEKQPLKAADPAFVASEPGSGPRHMTFHPNKKFAYLVEEITGTVATFKYQKGKLSLIERLPTHPADYKGLPGSADIHVSPDGRFLYVSNRGEENNIAIFSVNESSGTLTNIGYQSTGGRTPRNFIIDPTNNYLLAANQNTGNIVIFKIDQQTGLLRKTGDEIKISKPVCLQMIQE